MMRQQWKMGEEAMKYLGRVDKIVGVLASLGVTKSGADVNGKIIVSPTFDYEIEVRTVLYREGISRSEIEGIVPQRYLRTPASN